MGGDNGGLGQTGKVVVFGGRRATNAGIQESGKHTSRALSEGDSAPLKYVLCVPHASFPPHQQGVPPPFCHGGALKNLEAPRQQLACAPPGSWAGCGGDLGDFRCIRAEGACA